MTSTVPFVVWSVLPVVPFVVCRVSCRYLSLYDAPEWAWARSGLHLSQLLCVDAGLPPAHLRYVHVWSEAPEDKVTWPKRRTGECTLVRYGDALLPLE